MVDALDSQEQVLTVIDETVSVKLAGEIDESASDVVVHRMVR